MPRLRWTMIVLCFVATTINYVDRATMSVAAPFIQRDLHLGPAVMGTLMGAFFWTYAAMQVPGGWLVDRLGARLVYALAVGWWSAFTAATALVQGAGAIFGLRFALGIGEAGSYPTNAKVASLWFPRSERGIASAIFDSGSRTGSALSLPIVAALVGLLGWRLAFVCTGLLGLVWVVVWLALYRDPDRHRAVSPESLAALRAAQPKAPDGPAVPWRSLFRYRTVWGMMLGFFCLNFSFYFFTTWFPTYLMQARGFSLAQLGTVGMLPALAAIPAGLCGGLASDALYRRGWSLTVARKSCIAGGLLASSVIVLSSFVTSTVAALLLFTLCYSSLAFAGANIWALPGDVAPSQDHVASLGGIQNGAANLAGIAISTFTGVMLQITHGSFVVPLCVAGGFCVLGAATYLFVVGPLAPLPSLPPRAGRTARTAPAGRA